jgi:hypothetical protein
MSTPAAEVTRPCPHPRCRANIERIDGVVDARRGHRWFLTPCGHEIEADLAAHAYQTGVPPVFIERVTGIGLMAAERKRHLTEEGHTDEADAAIEEPELAWKAWCYLDRAAADAVANPDPPSMWPGERAQWKPGPTRIRMLVKAGALIAAEIDRLLAKGAQP